MAKDTKGRSTIRLVVGNAAELESIAGSNNCVYMNKSWEESLKYENADKILSKVGEGEPDYKYDEELRKISKRITSKGTRITKSERDAAIAKSSALVFHLPKDEIMISCQRNGFNLEEGKTPMQTTIAFGGNSSIDVGFGSKSNDVPYENLTRYKTLSEETKFVERKNLELENKEKLYNKYKGE